MGVQGEFKRAMVFFEIVLVGGDFYINLTTFLVFSVIAVQLPAKILKTTSVPVTPKMAYYGHVIH